MKSAFACCLLLLCGMRPISADPVPPHQARQYAYIGGYGGLFGFRVGPSGSLQSLWPKPLAKGVYFDQLLVDTRARNLFAITEDNKLLCYTIKPTGHLSLKSTIPYNVVYGTATIDSQTHSLYASDGDGSLLVYDISNPSRPVRRHDIVTPFTLQTAVVDQADRSLLLCGEDPRTPGRGGSFLLRYALHTHAAPTRVSVAQLLQGVSTSVLAGPDFVTGNDNGTLTVYSLKRGKPGKLLSSQPLLGADVAHVPFTLAYRPAGSFLYVSTFHGAGSAQQDQPASSVIVCHLSRQGQIIQQQVVGKDVPNPRPYLDKTGCFLYIVGEENTVDAYKIRRDGQLTFTVRRQVPALTGLVFADAK